VVALLLLATTSHKMNFQNLRKSPLFQGLSDEELQQLVDMGERVLLKAGETLITQGDLGDSAYVIVNGEYEVQKQTGQSLIKIDVRGVGEVVGEMALLSQTPRNASIISKTDSESLRIPKAAFETLLSTSSTAALAVLHWVMSRLIQNESLLHQQEKMAALGTMSAGLAHELNNPAAAAQRSAFELKEVQSKWMELTHKIEQLVPNENKLDWFNQLMQDASERFKKPLKLDALDKIDLVDGVQTWLDANGFSEINQLVPAMVDYGWDPKALDKIKSELSQSKELFNLSIQWVGISCSMNELLSEVQSATERVSKIVKAMKSYTYLDQAPILEVDVHEGLENTLIIMQHKLKHGVTIKRDYSPSLPRIQAYASELNQVWTNIIDNAVDAMKGRGEITLRTYAENGNVVVEISDNGPGIPQDIQARIFEPFFTTKAPGAGTGLGLHISHDIIATRHHGQLSVESEPGKTKFKAILPLLIG